MVPIMQLSYGNFRKWFQLCSRVPEISKNGSNYAVEFRKFPEMVPIVQSSSGNFRKFPEMVFNTIRVWNLIRVSGCRVEGSHVRWFVGRALPLWIILPRL